MDARALSAKLLGSALTRGGCTDVLRLHVACSSRHRQREEEGLSYGWVGDATERLAVVGNGALLAPPRPAPSPLLLAPTLSFRCVRRWVQPTFQQQHHHYRQNRPFVHTTPLSVQEIFETSIASVRPLPRDPASDAPGLPSSAEYSFPCLVSACRAPCFFYSCSCIPIPGYSGRIKNAAASFLSFLRVIRRATTTI